MTTMVGNIVYSAAAEFEEALYRALTETNFHTMRGACNVNDIFWVHPNR